MKTNKQLLQVARSQIGKGGAKFRKYVGLADGQPWCDAYVFWLYDPNGCGSLLPWKGTQRYYCPASYKWCLQNLAEIPMYLAMASDIVYFDWDKNGIPNHIGIAEKRRDTQSIYTIEGNTSGGKVDDKIRKGYILGVFRPHFKGEYKLSKLKIDSVCGYNTIASLQKALGGCTIDGVLGLKTIRRLQEYLAIPQDGRWQKGTSKTFQKMLKANGFYKGLIDGEFGKESTAAMQMWLNDKLYKEPTETVPTKADKMVENIKQLAWAYGTDSKKYSYAKGKPKEDYRLALKKYMKKSAKVSQSDCGYFVSTVVRKSGIDPKFLALRKPTQSFPKSDKFKTVLKGKKIPQGFLKPGDVIRYKKKGGHQHTLFCYGNNRIAEAGRKHYFPAIKRDTHKYNSSKVKIKTLEVLRVKE